MELQNTDKLFIYILSFLSIIMQDMGGLPWL